MKQVNTQSVWNPPPEALALESNEVHVWRAALDVEPAYLKRLEQMLSDDERERARRFFFEEHRGRFVVARGLLRSILAKYLNIAPNHLEFIYGAYGKPTLTGRFAIGDIRFNMSHSGELAVYAIARGREVGIDIERQRADFATREIAEKFFSPREVTALLNLPEHVQCEAFFNCWTRKEAYIKARGMGLSLPLDQFDVSLVPGEPAALLDTKDDPTEASRWRFQELLPGPGFAAALAVAGHNWQLKCWHVSESS